MNCVELVGRLTKDPDVRVGDETKKTFARFCLAVNRTGKDAGADYPSCVAFGKTAEFIGQYMKQGALMGLSGRIQTGKYEKDGRTYYTTDIVADRVEALSKRGEEEAPAESEKKAWLPKKEEPPAGFTHADDIPF